MGNTLALPLRLTSTGAFGSLEQDDATEISQSVALLLATRPGERRSVPEYGLPDPLFSGVDLAVVAAVVATWEDRADDVTLEQVLDGVSETVTLTHTAAQGTPVVTQPLPVVTVPVPPVVPGPTPGDPEPVFGLAADPDREGFFLPAGRLAEDQANPGYFLPLAGVTATEDTARPGFYDLTYVGDTTTPGTTPAATYPGPGAYPGANVYPTGAA